MTKRWKALGLAAALVLAGNVGKAAAPGDLTVGEFIAGLADEIGVQATTPEQAVRALRAEGFELRNVRLDAPATEGVVAAVSRDLGLLVSSSRPDALFGHDQADLFYSTFGPDIRASRGDTSTTTGADEDDQNRADPLTKGKGKKKGLMRSPSEPL